MQVLAQLALVHDRSHVRAGGSSVTDAPGLQAVPQPVDELVVHTVEDHQSGRGGAPLPGGAVAALQGDLDGQVEVGVVGDDQRVLAAHFQLHARPSSGRRSEHALTGGYRTGEGDGGDLRGAGEDIADVSAASHDEVEHTGGKSGPVQRVHQRPRAGRYRIGRLEHDRVAVGQRRGDLPGRDRDREVPGGDDRDHPHGLPRHRHLHPGP